MKSGRFDLPINGRLTPDVITVTIVSLMATRASNLQCVRATGNLLGRLHLRG